MRNLTITGSFTTKQGIEDLGYLGNMPNVWDGVPEEVLKDHDVSYDDNSKMYRSINKRRNRKMGC